MSREVRRRRVRVVAGWLGFVAVVVILSGPVDIGVCIAGIALILFVAPEVLG